LDYWINELQEWNDEWLDGGWRGRLVALPRITASIEHHDSAAVFQELFYPKVHPSLRLNQFVH
jgi:hypothetical protein